MRTILILAVAAATAAWACGCKSTTVVGKGGATLTLTNPGNVSVTQGATVEVNISIKRENLEGPVTISFSGLPSGVTVVDGDRKTSSDKETFVFKASDTADVVSGQEATVTASGAGGISAAEKFKVAVKAKP